MKKLFYLLSATAIGLIPVVANAQSNPSWYKNRFYIRGDIGASMPSNSFKNKDDNIDPYITKKPKKTALYNIGIGYKITDSIRSDLNFSYRNFRYKAHNAEDDINVSQKVKSYNIFLNGYYDFINLNKLFKPYLTAGIGYGQNKSSNLKEVDNGAPVLATTHYSGKKQNNFIWNIGLGTRVIMTDRFNLDVSYRYVDLGKVKTNYDAALPGRPSSQKIKSHEISCGVIINL